MVPQKTWVSENFGPISKTLEVFLMGFEVSFLSDFCVLESQTFLPPDLGVSDFFIFSFHLVFRSQNLAEFMGLSYSSRLRQ